MTLREGIRRSRAVRSIRESIHVIVKERSPNYFIMGFIFSAAILEIAGGVTSGWLVLDLPSDDVELGLVYVRYCPDGADCEIQITDNFNQTAILGNCTITVSDTDLLEYRIEAGVGILMALLATILTCKLTCCNRNLTNKSCFLSTVFIFSVISGASTLALVGRFGLDILDHHQEAEGDSPYKTPYSLILAGVGGIFASLAALTASIEMCRACCRGREPDFSAAASGQNG